MGRKKKSNEANGASGLNGHAVNGTAKLTTGDGTEIEGVLVDDSIIGSDNGPTLGDDDALEDVEAFSERAQQFFLANDFAVVRDLCCLTRAELLTAEGAEEILVDHVVAVLAGKGRQIKAGPAPVAAPPSAPRPKLTRYFSRKLTNKERGEISGEMMRAVLARQELEDKISEAKKVIAGLKKEQDVHDARVLELARQRHEGSVKDEVECFEKEGADPLGVDARPGVITYRGDTLEELEWRPLSPNERQGTLFAEGEKFLPAASASA